MNIRESLEEILRSDHLFGDSFYKTLFSNCPEARPYFGEIDMKRQALVLTMSLTLIEQYHSRGFKAIEHYLEHLGTKHGDIGVPRVLFAKWRDAMLIALEEFHGDDWSDDLAAQWHEAIDAVSEAMFHGYDERTGH